MTVTFNEAIIVPENFSVINSSVVLIDIPNSKNEDLNFTWSITDFQSNSMEIQLKF